MKSLPFKVTSIKELDAARQALMGQMKVEQVTVPEWFGNILQDKEPWLLAPETSMSRAMAELFQLGGGFTEGEPDHELALIALANFIAEAKKAVVRIGRKDDQYFDMNLVHIEKDGKGHTIGLIDEEPGYAPAYRTKHPLGLIVLPYYIDKHGKVYVNVAVRNEQGAPGGQPVVVAGEQTSLTKMVQGGIIGQAGGSVIAACVQDFGTIECEGVPNFEDIKKRTHWITYFDNTNRMGGGFKLSAVVRVTDSDDDLIVKYNSGMWVDYAAFMHYAKNPENKPIINSLLGVCLYLVELYA
jgi:hypothetical protein